MTHFTTSEWVDFARGTVSQDERAVMENHLETGCRKCRKEADLWQFVRETAKRGASSVPEDGTLRTVKGMFSLAARKGRSKHALIPKLLFDSLLNPLPTGFRSGDKSTRQLLFGAGSLRIDIRMEPRIDSESVALIGQVLDSTSPEGGLRSGSVALLKAGKSVAEAEMNSFGEFELESDLAERLELRVRLPLREEISIFLIDPALPKPRKERNPIDSKEVKAQMKARSTRKKSW